MDSERLTKKKYKMVARTTYQMMRGRMKKSTRWVKVRADEETPAPKQPEPRPEPKQPRPEPTRPPAPPSPRPEPKQPRPEPTRPPAPPSPRPEPEPRPERGSFSESRPPQPEPPRREQTHRPETSEHPRPRFQKPRYTGGWNRTVEVSVVLRTHNGAPWLEELLTNLKGQETSFETEIIAVDAQSEDRTLDILSRNGIATLTAPARDRFIDKAMERAVGRFVVFIEDRMLPRTNTWLTDLTRPLFDSPEVAVVTGRQVPGEGLSEFERAVLLSNPYLAGLRSLSFRRGSTSPGADFLPVFNMALSREAWRKRPFKELHTNEWLRSVLHDGGAKLYLPTPSVELKGGPRFKEFLTDSYQEGQTWNRNMLQLIGDCGRSIWKDWRLVHDSGLVENGRRGDAYWQILIIRSATIAGALEKQQGLLRKLLPSK